jgi:hypothetical protein
MRELSSRPFCSCDSRQVSLGDLSAAYRDTAVDERRMDITQMAWEQSRNIIRSPEIRDRILRAALDPVIASKARRGEFVQCLDHFGLLQITVN